MKCPLCCKELREIFPGIFTCDNPYCALHGLTHKTAEIEKMWSQVSDMVIDGEERGFVYGVERAALVVQNHPNRTRAGYAALIRAMKPERKP